MWGMGLPRRLALMGEQVAGRAPRGYRRPPVGTLSESSRPGIIDILGLAPERISVSPPGVDARFSPGGERSPVPLVVAVGRLVPVKRFDLLMRSLAEAKEARADLRAVIIGEGFERP